MQWPAVAGYGGTVLCTCDGGTGVIHKPSEDRIPSCRRIIVELHLLFCSLFGLDVAPISTRMHRNAFSCYCQKCQDPSDDEEQR